MVVDAKLYGRGAVKWGAEIPLQIILLPTSGCISQGVGASTIAIYPGLGTLRNIAIEAEVSS